MKRCSCEHWQTCPSCYPQGFDEHGARKPVEILSSREELRREITTLREQVEKLTKERDALKTVPMKYRRMQFNAELQEEVTQLQEQLAALAEQNAKLRDALTICVCAMQDYQAGIGITEMFDRGERIGRNVLLTSEFPDLASQVLNRIKENK